MIPALIGLYALRDHLEQAIAELEPVLPALEAWEVAQQRAAQEPAPDPEQLPVPPHSPDTLHELPKPTVGLFDPLPDPAPAERRSTNGATPATTTCERCGTPIEQLPRGARRRYCSGKCRQAAKAERAAQREAVVGLEPLPDLSERPFVGLAPPDDLRSDPNALLPPPLPWQREERTCRPYSVSNGPSEPTVAA